MRDGHPNSCAELSRWANRPASFVRKNKSGEERMCAYASTDNKADNSRAQVHRTRASVPPVIPADASQTGPSC